jgi:hypothetical protein
MLKFLRFLSLLLVTLTFGLTWCHVMEIPGKLRLSGEEWLTVQQNLYVAFGPPLGAPIEVAAIGLTWAVFLLVRRRGPATLWTFAAAISVTAGLVEWFWMVSPMNTIIVGLTADNLPADWPRVRNQWEIGHAIHALLFGSGFSALVIALLVETPGSSR